MIYNIAIAYFLLVNIVAFIAFGVDKFKSKRNGWRIPESTLMIMAATGGSVGALLGMKVFRHKTLHNKFRFGVPVILVAQIVAAAYFYL